MNELARRARRPKEPCRGLESDLRPGSTLKLLRNPEPKKSFPRSIWWLWAAAKLGKRFATVNFRAVTMGAGLNGPFSRRSLRRSALSEQEGVHVNYERLGCFV